MKTLTQVIFLLLLIYKMGHSFPRSRILIEGTLRIFGIIGKKGYRLFCSLMIRVRIYKTPNTHIFNGRNDIDVPETAPSTLRNFDDGVNSVKMGDTLS